MIRITGNQELWYTAKIQLQHQKILIEWNHFLPCSTKLSTIVWIKLTFLALRRALYAWLNVKYKTYNRIQNNKANEIINWRKKNIEKIWIYLKWHFVSRRSCDFKTNPKIFRNRSRPVFSFIPFTYFETNSINSKLIISIWLKSVADNIFDIFCLYCSPQQAKANSVASYAN